MSRYFTHYWQRSTCDDAEARGEEGVQLLWVAGELFFERGVQRGDRIYVVNIRGGQLRLIARMEVDQVVRWPDAVSILRTDDIWEASWVVIAKQGTGTRERFHRWVPQAIAESLEFEGADGPVGLKWAAPDRLNGQTLRGVRQLTPKSAKLLDGLLAKDGG